MINETVDLYQILNKCYRKYKINIDFICCSKSTCIITYIIIVILLKKMFIIFNSRRVITVHLITTLTLRSLGLRSSIQKWDLIKLHINSEKMNILTNYEKVFFLDISNVPMLSISIIHLYWIV